jgi:hypothetical protein
MIQQSRLKRITDTKVFIFFSCGFLGAIYYILIFGGQFINPLNNELILYVGDIFQHYTGWHYFRNSDWQFPVGLMGNEISYPFSVSVLFTDSIPLFAILFKLLSPVLPDFFQYFGIYGLVCFFLQGAIAGILLKRLTGNTIISVTGSLFFSTSALMMFRIHMHTALTAHFIILLCIYVCITKNDKPRTTARSITVWCLIAALVTMLHLYFIPVVYVFMLFYVLDDAALNRKIIPPLAVTASATVTVLLVLYSLGAFHAPGINNFDMNEFIGGGIPVMFVGTQRTTLGNLGWGVNTALIAFTALLIRKIMKSIKEIPPEKANESLGRFGLFLRKTLDNTAYRRNVFAVVIFTFFILFAMSPIISWEEVYLFTLPLPSFVMNIWGMFRFTYRYLWIPSYIILLFVICRLQVSIRKEKTAILVLTAMLAVNLIGAVPQQKGRVEHRMSESTSENLPQSEIWEQLRQPNYTQYYFFGSLKSTRVSWGITPAFVIGNLAMENGMKMSNFYFARDIAPIMELQKEEARRVLQGEPRDNFVYVFADYMFEEKYLNRDEAYATFDFYDFRNAEGLYLYLIDGVIIGVSRELDYPRFIP